MTEDKKNPVFRHFQKDWSFDLHDKKYSLVSHTAFEKDAKKCMLTLKNLLVEEYGDEVLKGFHDGMTGLNNPHKTYGSVIADTFIFEEDEEDDKWLNNSIPCTVTNMSVLEESKANSERPGVTSGQSEEESVFTNLDKSAAFSEGSDRTDDISIPSQTSATVPSLTSSKQTEDNGADKTTEGTENQQDMEIDKEIEITTKDDQEGTFTQNSSISGLTGNTETQINEELFKRMSQSKSVIAMLSAGILTEEQIHQIACEITTNETGTAAADQPGQGP